MGIKRRSGCGAKSGWLTAMLFLTLAAWAPAQSQAGKPSNLKRVLVLDKNAGGDVSFAESRRDLKTALAELASAHGFEATILGQNLPGDSLNAAFSPANLSRYQVVIFDYNDGVDRFVAESVRPGFEAWIRNGGGLIVIHEASAFITDWPFLVEALVECFYGPHGNNKPRADLHHDSEGLAEGSETQAIFKGLSAPASFQDMFISFRHSPRGRPGVTILSTVDENSFTNPVNGPMGADHPVVWTNAVDKGKVVHNSLGVSWPASNVYTQSNGYLTKMLYNLMRYAAGDFIGCTDSLYAEYNPDATKSDPTACKTVSASPIRTLPSRNQEPILTYRPGTRSLLVQFQSSEEHDAVLLDIRGHRLQRRTGMGAARYALPLPGKAGVYLVRTIVGGKSRTQRIGIP